MAKQVLFGLPDILGEADLWPSGVDSRSIANSMSRAAAQLELALAWTECVCMQIDVDNEVAGYKADQETCLITLRDSLGLCLPCMRSGEVSPSTCDMSHQ